VSSVASQTAVYYLTAEQAQATFTCNAPPPTTPTKLLHGSVAGVASDATVSISMGRNGAVADATVPTFQVAVGDGLADLVATHNPPETDVAGLLSFRTDKMIIRRGENHANGATMAVLDFSSPEAFAPQANTLTISNFGISHGQLILAQNVLTERGGYGFLGLDIGTGTTTVTTFGVPVSRLAAGDLHQVDVRIQDRRILFFYHTPADRTIPVGPTAHLPLITEPTNAPGELLRFEVRSQPEYDAGIGVNLSQSPSGTMAVFISVNATREYFGGTPTTWSLVVPDLTAVPGFSPSWGFTSGTTLWTVGVSGVPYRLSPSSARDGDVYRGASVTGSIVLGQ
jgi:hypothetical protein